MAKIGALLLLCSFVLPCITARLDKSNRYSYITALTMYVLAIFGVACLWSAV